MMLDHAEITARAGHFFSLLFTEWTSIGLAVAAIVWLFGSRVPSPRRREQLLVAASLGVLTWFVSVPLASVWLLYAITFYLAVEYCRHRWLAVARRTATMHTAVTAADSAAVRRRPLLATDCRAPRHHARM